MLKNRYRLLGSEEAPVICDYCKRKHVQRYWAVEDTSTGEILRCGSSCIRKALSATTKEFNAEVDATRTTIRHRYFDLSRDLEIRAEKARVAWRASVGKTCGFPAKGTEAWSLTERCLRLSSRARREEKRIVHLGR